MFRKLSPGRVILAGTIIVGAYLLFSAGSNLLNSYHLESIESRLRSEVDGLQVELEQLNQVRDYLRSDDYVEYMARRVFGLVKPGETLVIVQAPPSKDAAGNDASGDRWWQRIFDSH